MKLTFSIKLNDTNIAAKPIMFIKKATSLSISEIKSRIANNEPIYECSCTDNKGLALIIKLYEGLSADGVEAQLYEAGFPETLEVLKNALESHRQTALEVGLTEDDIDY